MLPGSNKNHSLKDSNYLNPYLIYGICVVETLDKEIKLFKC